MKGNNMIDGNLEFGKYESGVDDAKNDIALGAIPCGGPTEPPCSVSLDYIVNELRLGVGASDAYIAGYLSVVFG